MAERNSADFIIRQKGLFCPMSKKAIQHCSGLTGFQQPKTLDKMMNDQNTFFPPNFKIYGCHQGSPEIELMIDCGYGNGLVRFSRPCGLADTVQPCAGFSFHICLDCGFFRDKGKSLPAAGLHILNTIKHFLAYLAVFTISLQFPHKMVVLPEAWPIWLEPNGFFSSSRISIISV